MSDYLFMLENHLSPDQNRVVAEMQSAASALNFSLFLVGGAMRDMLGGFQIRDLDFTVEGNPAKLVKILTAKAGAKVLSEDERRRSVELLFTGGVTAEVSMSRTERHGRAGSPPQVTPGTIQDDLRRRDFTVNAITLSLNRASRGLLLDPLNGLADIGRKELRVIQSGVFHDDPVRLLRLIRLRLRLGYTVEERTQSLFDSAREAKIEEDIPHRMLCEELKLAATEPNPSEVVAELARLGLLTLFSPSMTEAKLNLAGLVKLEKARRQMPAEAQTLAASWGPFLYVFTEKLNAKERQALIRRTEMKKAEVDAWQKLPLRAKKLESALKSARLRKPSQIFGVLSKAAPDEILFLLYHSQARLVHDRLKNYLQRYIALSQEITDAEVEAKGLTPGTAKFHKMKEEMVAARLDGRTRKPPPPPVEPVPMAGPMRGRGVR
ncbi:MAG TPA: hypothetical protein VL285_14815 [Bryobacteraceae bacterium]|jgi:tRNA nucleotidyltransferase/poly(A) polymerase|nr:hypothetical protein [Bryobacteraceae bacterium]